MTIFLEIPPHIVWPIQYGAHSCNLQVVKSVDPWIECRYGPYGYFLSFASIKRGEISLKELTDLIMVSLQAQSQDGFQIDACYVALSTNQNKLEALVWKPITAGSKTDFKYSYYCRECIIRAHFNLHSPLIKIELIDPDKGYVHYPLLRNWFFDVSKWHLTAVSSFEMHMVSASLKNDREHICFKTL